MGKRVVSGMRPTGRLHLGHYLGVLKKWLELQKEYSPFYFVADWHALSTKYDEGLNLRELSLQLVQTWLAVGVDPEKCVIFRQSEVKEHAELYLILNMITPISWLERNPTYKETLSQPEYKEKNNAGFLTYPVLQTADIILYDGELVPIGEDQRPHLELAREIVRRFHHLFGVTIFVEPQELLTETPRLPGLDGRKMSKSYNNAIYLDDSPEEIWEKVRRGVTDPKRIRKSDPGTPEVCTIYHYHRAFSTSDRLREVEEGCRQGKIGCVQCKKWCAEAIERAVAPIRDRLSQISPSTAEEVLAEGSRRAREIASRKMEEVNRVVLH
jgi:tryptophanyl-tRNA synthetase